MATNLNAGLNNGLNPGLRQSISGGVDSLGLFRSASLDLRFAGKKTLTDRVSGTNLITFSRASSGTYVGSDRLIKTSAVNKLLYSNEFTNAAWTRNGLTLVSSTTTAPDGTATATTYTPSSTDSRYINQNGGSVIGQSYVNSIWIKGSANATLGLRRPGMDQSALGSDGTEAINVTTEWQKFTAVTTSAENTGGKLIIDLRSINGASVPSGFELSLWHAQTEEGTTATDYISTGATISGAPRFDHDPVTGESLGLLIEESRTNYILNSNFPVSSNGSSTITDVSGITTPDGNVSTVKRHVNLGNGWDRFGDLNSGSAGTVYTGSLYVRTVSGTETIEIDVVDSPKISYTITENWTRIYASGSTPGNNYRFFDINLQNNDIYIWGAQLEEGSFPTSYIPTTSSTITRSPDIATIEGNKFAKTNLLEYSERFDQSAWAFAVNGTGSSPVLSPGYTSPDGTSTAYRLQCDLNGGTTSSDQSYLVTTTFTGFTNPHTNTTSIYVKSNTNSNQSLYFRNVQAAGGEGLVATSEWQRFSITGTVTSTIDNLQVGARGTLSDDSIDVLIWGAQVEEGSELTDYTPSVETFVSRASSATYVDDATGLIKTTPVNLFRYSEEFDQGAWAKVGSVTANVELAPDGSQTADRTAFVSTKWLIYDNSNSASLPGFPQDYPFTVTNKWERQSTTFTTPSGCTSVRFYPLRSSNDSQWIYQSTSGLTSNTTYTASAYYKLAADNVTVLAWGAQLEEGTTATPYIKTTNTISGAARYENGELLLEPARTNLLSYSQDFTNSFWRNALSSSTVSSPDGGQNAYELTNSNTLNQDTVESAPANTTNTTSIFAKYAGTGNAEGIQIRVGGVGSNVPWANFDLANGSKENTSVASGTSAKGDTWTLIDHGIEPFANGWYRIHITYTCSDNSKIQFRPSDSPATDVESSTGSGKVLVFGAQIEVSSPASLGALYTTSYIPTTTSAVTRAADVSTSAPGVDSWYNQSEGTFYGQASKLGTDNNSRLFITSTGSSTRTSDVYRARTSTQLTLRSSSGVFSNYGDYTEPFTLTAAYKANDYAGSLNGVLAFTGVSGSVPTCDRLILGNYYTGSYYANGHISRLAYFPTRKTDQQLVKMTS